MRSVTGHGGLMMTRATEGFTLVEVLLALFLMWIGLMAAAPLFVYSVKETSSGADLGSVGALAVGRMELLRQAAFSGGLTAGGSLASNVVGYSDTSNPNFTVRWQIVDNGIPVTLKTLSVRVIATRQAMGLRKEITLTSLRAQ